MQEQRGVVDTRLWENVHTLLVLARFESSRLAVEFLNVGRHSTAPSQLTVLRNFVLLAYLLNDLEVLPN